MPYVSQPPLNAVLVWSRCGLRVVASAGQQSGVLTVVTVILLPLTLITGIFGMNVKFPGFETAHAWWAIVGGMLVVLGGLLGFFRYKRWL